MTLLRVAKLSVRRGPHRVLEAIDLEVGAGEVVALIGANGAGKSTLLQAIAGLIPSHAERLERGGVYLLPDEAQPCAELTVAEQLAFSAALARAPQEQSQTIAARLGLGGLSSARCGSLSRGEARRVLLHGALVSALPLLLLDEPLGTFDPLQLLEVLEALKARARSGAGLLVTCHQLSDAEKLADRIVVLHEGRVLAQGTLAQLQAQARCEGASLEAVFLALLKDLRAAA